MRSSLSPTDIEYFLEVVASGNLTRASERLHVSQPSLSIAIKRLEEDLGTQLLIRTKAGVQPTKLGSQFASQARQVLSGLEELRTSIKKQESTVSGKFTLGCHPSVAIYTLPEFLPGLLREHHDLSLQLVHGPSREITEKVINWEVDIGIVVNPTQHPDLVITDLATDEVTLWRAGKCVEDILICDSGLLQSQSILKQLKKIKFSYSRILQTSNLEVATALIASGCGIGILPTRVAKNSGGLKKAFQDAPIFQDKICVIYRAEIARTLAAKEIVKAIKESKI